jgi:1,5-anhydro-D-fructose reductase (1,5-anhydro-D-mannitol-forming)
MSARLRWGIVGPGQLADDWIAPAISASASGELVACAGQDLARTRAFAERHEVPRVYDDYRALLRDEAVEAVFVMTPNHLHHPVVVAAAEAGKHVLCDKPMALSVEQASEMLEACQRAGVVLRIGLQLRLQPVLQAAARIVAEGRLGELREISVQRCAPLTQAGAWRRDLAQAGLGALYDVGVHVLDFIQWILGERIVAVSASARPPRASGRPDETAVALLELQGGVLGTLRVSREVPIARNDLQIFGSRGMLVSGPLRWAESHELTLRTSDGEERSSYSVPNLYLDEVEAFARALAGEPDGLASGQDGLQLVRVAEALVRSLESGSRAEVRSVRPPV